MAGFLKRLFGGGGAQPEDAVGRAPDLEYKGVAVRATPVREADGQWRLAGTLTRVAGETSITRRFVRADLMPSRDQAATASLDKARLIIDQNGDRLWSGQTDRPV